jgi:DNA-binding transcriptional LysR family regulator
MLGVMKELKGTKGGHLIISVVTTANYFVTQLLAEFSQRHENINITLDVGNRNTLLNQLENHEPDMVIMGEPPKGHGLQAERFMENPLVVIAAAAHPLARLKRPLLLTEIVAERFIVREKGSGTRSTIERHLHKHHISYQTTLEMRSNETIKHAVGAGLGLGIVSMHTIQPELDSGRLVILAVENFPIRRHWYVVMRKGKRLSPIAREFKSFVMTEAPRFVRFSHPT